MATSADPSGTPGASNRRPLRIAVAGASGFVGRAVVEDLRRQYEVVGLSRSPAKPTPTGPGEVGLRWEQVDLFSLLEVERALEGVDVALYLVHSMLPSAELTQGAFSDFDLILADNFSRAARSRGVGHILYLGGLIPEGEQLSRHLESRLEVEKTLRAHGVPVTALRASIIIGPAGSSLRMVENLVRRLPVMITPAWSQMPTQTIDRDDVVALMRWCVEHLDEVSGRVAEIGGPDVVTYRDLMARTARALGLRRKMIPVSVVSPHLSKLWVSLVTQQPMALVSPLIESLRHTMIVRDGWLQRRAGIPGRRLDASLAQALAGRPQPLIARPRARIPSRRDVRSVSRLPLPPGWSAEDVAREYFRWLPEALAPLVFVEFTPNGRFRIHLRGLHRPLLELSHSAERSTSDRPLLYISGGSLARLGGPGRGRLEFREVLDGRRVLACIHSFAPSLPWQLYQASQAWVHLVVMRAFELHLQRIARAAQPRIAAQAGGRPSRSSPPSG